MNRPLSSNKYAASHSSAIPDLFGDLSGDLSSRAHTDFTQFTSLGRLLTTPILHRVCVCVCVCNICLIDLTLYCTTPCLTLSPSSLPSLYPRCYTPTPLTYVFLPAASATPLSITAISQAVPSIPHPSDLVTGRFEPLSPEGRREEGCWTPLLLVLTPTKPYNSNYFSFSLKLSSAVNLLFATKASNLGILPAE